MLIAEAASVHHEPVIVECDIEWVQDGLPLIALGKETKLNVKIK